MNKTDDALHSIVLINDKTQTLRFIGGEGTVDIDLSGKVDLQEVWEQLGAPKGLDPEKWINDHNMEDSMDGTLTDGDHTVLVRYLTSLVKDGPLVDYVMRMYDAQLSGEPGEPGCYLI